MLGDSKIGLHCPGLQDLVIEFQDSVCLNVATDVQFVTNDGRRFQIVGSATEKDWPAVAVRTRGRRS